MKFKEQIVKLLDSAKIVLDETEMDSLMNRLETNELDDMAVLKDCTQSDVTKYLEFPIGRAKKFIKAIKEHENDRKDVIEAVELPQLPEDWSTTTPIATGNTKINLKMVHDYIRFGVLYSMGIENIASTLMGLIVSRADELDEPNPEEISLINMSIAKFKDVDATLASALDTSMWYLSNRHKMSSVVADSMLNAVIPFINDALGFRMEIASVDNIILKRIAGGRVATDISIENLAISSEDMVIKLNKSLRGDRYLVIKESLKLYDELLGYLNNTEVHKHVGARDYRDMLSKVGATYTPKDIAVFNKLPELVYQILHGLENESLVNNDRALVKYLQNIWSKSKVLDWSKFGELVKKSGDKSCGVNFIGAQHQSVNTEEEQVKQQGVVLTENWIDPNDTVGF